MKHFLENDLHVEVSLDPVDDVHLVEVSLLVKPSVRRATFKDHRHSKFPYFHVVRYKVQHRAKVFLTPELSELFANECTVSAAFIIGLLWCLIARDRVEVLKAEQVLKHGPVFVPTGDNDGNDLVVAFLLSFDAFRFPCILRVLGNMLEYLHFVFVHWFVQVQRERELSLLKEVASEVKFVHS